MDRREFLRRMAQFSSAAATGTIIGCDRPERRDEPDGPVEPHPHPEPGARPESPPETSQNTTQLAVVHTTDRTEGVHQAVQLLDHNFQEQRVFLKPNFNSADPAPGSTHNAVLSAIVRHCHGQRARSVTVGDRSGMGETESVMRQKQIFTLAGELDFNTVIFDDLRRNDWIVVDEEEHHWSRGFAFPRPVVEADAYVQTCTLKTHRFGGHFTMALKNNVGLAAKQLPGDTYDYMTELHQSDDQRRMIAELNTAISHDLIVLDAVQGFYEEGPDAGPTADFNVIIAGTDPVAIDAVGVALLRRHGTTDEVSRGSIADLDQIARAIELGVGTADLDDIEFLTPDGDSEALVAELTDYLDD